MAIGYYNIACVTRIGLEGDGIGFAGAGDTVQTEITIIGTVQYIERDRTADTVAVQGARCSIKGRIIGTFTDAVGAAKIIGRCQVSRDIAAPGGIGNCPMVPVAAVIR